MDLLGPCTNVFLTAYAHVRTEPQRDIGQTRGSRTVVPLNPLLVTFPSFLTTISLSVHFNIPLPPVLPRVSVSLPVLL